MLGFCLGLNVKIFGFGLVTLKSKALILPLKALVLVLPLKALALALMCLALTPLSTTAVHVVTWVVCLQLKDEKLVLAWHHLSFVTVWRTQSCTYWSNITILHDYTVLFVSVRLLKYVIWHRLRLLKTSDYGSAVILSQIALQPWLCQIWGTISSTSPLFIHSTAAQK